MQVNTLFSLEDFERISFDGFNFSLPKETDDMISSIADEVGAPTYVRTPNFQKRDKMPNKDLAHKRRKNKNMDITDDDWEAIRKFHATEVKKKEGIEKHIDSIRTFLNKLSDKNYELQKNAIIEEINKLIEAETDEENMSKISNLVFTTASSNKFYSAMYATLYKELMENFDIMKTVFHKNFKTFLNLFEVIEYVDSKEDYDKFCQINKINDERRAMSVFLVNLMKNDIIEKEEIISIITKLQNMILNLITMENNTNQVEEVTENIYLLTTNAHSHLNDCEDWETIICQISNMSKLKIKNYPSLSRKTTFKYMDMLDEFNK